ncbi:MAG: M23 family peptidase, partial [Comamonas sp.]
MGLTAGIASAPAWAAKAAQSDSVWPQDSRVPGGVARLSLGPASTRPKFSYNDAPALVQWMGLTAGIASAPAWAAKAAQSDSV